MFKKKHNLLRLLTREASCPGPEVWAVAQHIPGFQAWHFYLSAVWPWVFILQCLHMQNKANNIVPVIGLMKMERGMYHMHKGHKNNYYYNYSYLLTFLIRKMCNCDLKIDPLSVLLQLVFSKSKLWQESKPWDFSIVKQYTLNRASGSHDCTGSTGSSRSTKSPLMQHDFEYPPTFTSRQKSSFFINCDRTLSSLLEFNEENFSEVDFYQV